MKIISKVMLSFGSLLFLGPIASLVGTVYAMFLSISLLTKETASAVIMAEYISISLLSVKYGLLAGLWVCRCYSLAIY